MLQRKPVSISLEDVSNGLRTQVVCCDDYPILEFDSKYRGSCDNRRRGMCFGTVVMKIRRVVYTVDIVTRLRQDD